MGSSGGDGWKRDLHCMIPTDGEAGQQRWIDDLPFGKRRETVAGKLELLKSTDRRTWAAMMQAIRRVQTGQIRQVDLDRGHVVAPAGLKVSPRGLNGPKPWLAEIKANRTRNPREWHRVYFGDVGDEPGEVTHRMVASGMHTKTETQRGVQKQQTLSMEAAMKALIWWCGNSSAGVSYRPENWDRG